MMWVSSILRNCKAVDDMAIGERSKERCMLVRHFAVGNRHRPFLLTMSREVPIGWSHK